MPKYLSGRSKKNSSSNLPLDRYNYLSLGDAEPNPGDPRTTLGPSGTGEKSIIGKLAREGVYQKQVYVSKPGEKPKTKVELVREIAAELDLNANDLSGLDKAPKGVLKLLCESI